MENTYQLRTFADVLNQWTEALVAENKRPDADSYALMLLMRIGPLAQRLIMLLMLVVLAGVLFSGVQSVAASLSQVLTTAIK